MELSNNGIDLIVSFEGCALAPYNDVAGFATVGIGHLIRKSCILPTDKVITKDEAYALFRQDAAGAIHGVTALVKVPLTQNQFDALVSWTYNLGVNTLLHSSVLRLLNAQNYAEASQHMLLYNEAGGKVIPGLVRRRAAEVALFLKQ